MITMTVTDFSRRMKDVLNQVEYQGVEVVLVRNRRPLAKLVPQVASHTALEVMADLYSTLPGGHAEGWIDDSRAIEAAETPRDPWAG